jgi:Flp pilus assembly protein TadG
MGARRGQVVVFFALALPALLGFLGLALDGGYYFAVGGAVQFAADAGARTAVVDLQTARSASATTDGSTMAQSNLTGLRLTNTSVELAYNDSPTATPSGAGWSTGTPTSSTRAVRSTVTGTYSTLFLGVVKVPSVTLQRQAVAVVGAATIPLAICTRDFAADSKGPLVIWDDRASLCGLSSWDGLVDVNRTRSDCTGYREWFLPQPAVPVPSVGTTMELDLRRCRNVDNWLSTYISGGGRPIMSILVVDVADSGRLKGCLQVTVNPGRDIVTATPVSASTTLQPCGSGVLQTY